MNFTFDNAISFLKLNKNADDNMVAIFYKPAIRYFGFYSISIDPEDFDYFSITFEGAYIFNHLYSGEEEYYSIDDVPDEARKLIYRLMPDIHKIYGMLPEYALFDLFPSLPNPDDVFTESDKRKFMIALDNTFPSTNKL